MGTCINEKGQTADRKRQRQNVKKVKTEKIQNKLKINRPNKIKLQQK
jgi:hypothetical protein